MNGDVTGRRMNIERQPQPEPEQNTDRNRRWGERTRCCYGLSPSPLIVSLRSVSVKREAQPNRSAVSFCCLIRRRPVVVVSPPSPYRVYSASPLLLTGRGALILRALNSTRARPRLFQPLPFQRDGGGNDGGGGGGSGGGRAGGRSETRHLKLAPTKTTARRRRRRAWAGPGSERASGLRRPGGRGRGREGGRECWSCPNRLSSFRKSLHLQRRRRRRRRRLERLTTVQCVHGCARWASGPAAAADGGVAHDERAKISLSLLTPGRPTQR